MSLRFVESFDKNATLNRIWDQGAGSRSTSAVRTGTYGWRDTGAIGFGSDMVKTIDAQGTWIIAQAYRSSGVDGGGLLIMATKDAGTVQGCVRHNSDGTFSLLRGTGSVVATSTNSISANNWFFMEFKHIIANSGGTLELRVDGSVWATFTGDTQETANATANQISIGGTNQTDDHDDIHVLDGQGSINNDYLGDRGVYCLLASGAGNAAQFTPSAGSNFQNVDEDDPDGDTTYNSESSVGQKDTFAFTDLPFSSGSIAGIQISIYARDESVGASSLERIYRSGGTEDEGPAIDPSSSYAYTLEIVEEDPLTTDPFTVTDINAAEFGYKKVS